MISFLVAISSISDKSDIKDEISICMAFSARSRSSFFSNAYRLCFHISRYKFFKHVKSWWSFQYELETNPIIARYKTVLIMTFCIWPEMASLSSTLPNLSGIVDKSTKCTVSK